MNTKTHDLTGQRFSRLVVEGFACVVNRSARWSCRCDCGSVKVIAAKSLVSGKSVSCGCFRKEQCAAANKKRLTTHGMTAGGNSRTYRVWANMISRCTNQKFDSYPWYGGRGISVCNEWKVFSGFLQDMGEITEGMSIDRIDSNGNYEKTNCRLVLAKEQQRNTRNNVLITIDGRCMSVAEWAEQPGAVNVKTIYARIKRGWEAKRSVFEPARRLETVDADTGEILEAA